jgi:hypothetical protein
MRSSFQKVEEENMNTVPAHERRKDVNISFQVHRSDEYMIAIRHLKSIDYPMYVCNRPGRLKDACHP